MSIEDPLVLGGKSFDSRFILGSGKYSLDLVEAAVEHAGAQIITLALRRANSETDSILAHIPEGVTLLPNTSGARLQKRPCVLHAWRGNSAAATS